MRRAILFLIFAFFLAMVIQPNLKKNQKSMFLNKRIRQLLPMIQSTIRAVNRKLSSVLMQVMEVVMQDIQVMDIRVKKI